MLRGGSQFQNKKGNCARFLFPGCFHALCSNSTTSPWSQRLRSCLLEPSQGQSLAIRPETNSSQLCSTPAFQLPSSWHRTSSCKELGGHQWHFALQVLLSPAGETCTAGPEPPCCKEPCTCIASQGWDLGGLLPSFTCENRSRSDFPLPPGSLSPAHHEERTKLLFHAEWPIHIALFTEGASTFSCFSLPRAGSACCAVPSEHSQPAVDACLWVKLAQAGFRSLIPSAKRKILSPTPTIWALSLTLELATNTQVSNTVVFNIAAKDQQDTEQFLPTA